MGLFNKIMNKLSQKGRKHNKVGTLMVSKYVGAIIIVTRYIDDDHWYFKKYHLESGTVYGNEMRAGTKLSWFEENGKMVKEGK